MLLRFEYLQADERIHLGAQFGTGLPVHPRRLRVHVDGDLLHLALPSSPPFYVSRTKTVCCEKEEVPPSLGLRPGGLRNARGYLTGTTRGSSGHAIGFSVTG